MPLPILGALVVLGIGGLVALIHFLGGTKRLKYTDEAAAALALTTDYPNARIRETFLADDQRAALFDLADGVGFAAPFGEGRLTRVLAPNDVTGVEEGPEGLTIRLTDYTAPRLTVRMANAEQRAAWKARLLDGGKAQ